MYSVRQWILTVYEWGYWEVWAVRVEVREVICYSICGSLLKIERWTSEHRAFAVEIFFRNNDSVKGIQWLFWLTFVVPSPKPILCRNIILSLARNFRSTTFGTTRTKKGCLLGRWEHLQTSKWYELSLKNFKAISYSVCSGFKNVQEGC